MSSTSYKQIRNYLNYFLIVVYSHLFEHIAQMFQLYVLGWTRPQSLGLLGLIWPQLIHSEYLHYGHALFMLVGIYYLTKYMYNKHSLWWMNLTLLLAFYHHFEHLLLLIQSISHVYFFDKTIAISIGQLWFPRIELHFFYNILVGLPLMIALNKNKIIS
jgi:hypothetical protein